MAEDERRIDWEGLATRALDTAIVVIGNRVQGIRTPTAGGVSVSPTSVNVWSSQNMMPYILGGMAIIAAVLIFKK